MLGEHARPLGEAHQLVMFDLDGVIYVGGAAVPGAPEAVAALRGAGRHIAFVTNNASRTPDDVAARLESLGVGAAVDDVVTSAQAAARLILDQHGSDTRVLALGGRGLHTALTEVGLTVCGPPEEGGAWPEVEVVASGYGPDVRWRDVMVAATLVRDGTPYVASNTDGTIPTPQGLQPGHGVLVETIRRFSGAEPQVAGKPSPPLLVETMRRIGVNDALMVGDRLDTDIAGGAAVGVETLLVMTGVCDAADLVAAQGGERPTYVGADLSALDLPHPVPDHDGDRTVLGGWTGRIDGDTLTVEGDGDAHDWWRVVAAAGWRHRDTTGEVVDVSALTAPVAPAAQHRR